MTNMNSMFSGCSSLTSLDLSSFNTANVTNMAYMFAGCTSLTSLDVSSFNTANVTDMNNMFICCSSLTCLDLSCFDASKVIDMNWMFGHCTSLKSLDVSNFNTNCTSIGRLFFGCSSLTNLDLSSFYLTDILQADGVFGDCRALKTIYANNWTSRFSFVLFTGCDNLVGGQGTKIGRNLYGYDKNGNPLYYECSEYENAAHIDGGKDNPGLFTAK